MRTLSIGASSGRPGRWLGTAILGWGLLAALLSTHPVVLLTVVVLSATAAAAVTATTGPAELLRARGVTGRWARVAVVSSTVVGAVGASVGLGASGLALFLLVLAAAWFLARGATPDDRDAVPARPRAVTAGAAADGAAGPPVPPCPPASVSPGAGSVPAEERLAGLSDIELCWAWRNSCFAAQHAVADPARLDRISRTRRGYLDEIQRRDPRGFAVWLESGARAASNPPRYWTSDA